MYIYSAHVWVGRRGCDVPHASGESTRMWINKDASHT